ncbi:MAG: LysR family transcriptional regulator [Rhodobacterales bacterium]|nr:LysR family transcriptional regulator [Rhodobacterales bacterium]
MSEPDGIISTERMDWDNMRVFRIVAELGSMNAAAHRLQESAPTIGRKIDQLEKDLNTVLLVRTTRGVELTDAGRIALSHIHAMAESVGEVFENAGNRDRDVEGRIVLATGDGLGPYWIAPRLPQFQEANPKVQLRLRVVDTVPDLLEGEADIAIQFSEPKSPEIIGRKLGVLHYMSFASETYLEGRELPNSLFEYYRYKTILHEGYVHQIERWAPRIAELKKMIDYSLVTNSAAGMIEVCANGGGIAVLPSYIGDVDHRLKPLNLPEIAPIQFWLTYTERVRRLPHGQAVLDWLWTIFDERRIAWFRDAFVHPSQIKRGADSQIARIF